MISSNASDFFIEAENNDFNFDEFIMNCKVIGHESCQDTSKKLSDVKDLSIKYNIDEFIFEHIPEEI